jgi:hypothetical protein
LIAPSTESVFHEKLVIVVPNRESSPVSLPPPPKQPQQSSYTLMIQCDIGRPNIIFPADSHNKDSRLLVISLGLDFSYLYRYDGYINMRYQVHRAKAYVEQPMTVNVKVAPILEPVSFVLDMETVPKEGSCTKLSIQGDVKMRLAYSDAVMITSIIKGFTDPKRNVDHEIELALQSSSSSSGFDDVASDTEVEDSDSFVDVSESLGSKKSVQHVKGEVCLLTCYTYA